MHEIAHDDGLLDCEFPVAVFAGAVFGLAVGCVADVLSFVGLAVFFGPFHGFAVFFGVVDAFRHAADDLGHVDRFVAHAEIFLEEVGIDHRSGDAHRYAAHREIRFAAHRGHSLCGACEAEYLLGYVGGYGVVVKILHVVTVDAECRQTFLRVGGEYRCEIYGSGALCAVEAPDSLGPVGVHIHSLASVAPAGGDGDGAAYAFALEFLVAGCGFGHPAYCGVGYHAFHGRSVAVAEVGRYEVGHSMSQGHGFLFKAFAYAALTAVDRRTDTDFRIVAHNVISVICCCFCVIDVCRSF